MNCRRVSNVLRAQPSKFGCDLWASRYLAWHKARARLHHLHIKFMTPTSSTHHYLVYTASKVPLFESNHSHLILREHVDENFRPDVLTHKYSSVSSALRFNASPSMASRMQFDCESYWDFKCEYTDSLCAGCFSSIVQSKYAGQRLKNGAGCGHPA